MSVDINEMVNYLGLTDKIQWDLALYWIFLLNIVLLMIQGEGSALGTLLSIIVLVSAVIDKVYGFGYMIDPGPYTPEYCHEKVFIGTYLIRVAMFLAPLSIAAMTKNGKARGVGVLAGVSGAAYMAARWYFDQRNSPVEEFFCSYLLSGAFLQYAGLTFFVTRRALRSRLAALTIHWDIPVTVAGDLAPDNIEI